MRRIKQAVTADEAVRCVKAWNASVAEIKQMLSVEDPGDEQFNAGLRCALRIMMMNYEDR